MPSKPMATRRQRNPRINDGAVEHRYPQATGALAPVPPTWEISK